MNAYPSIKGNRLEMEGKVRDLPLGAALFVRVFAPGLGSSSEKKVGPLDTMNDIYIYIYINVCIRIPFIGL